jgi:hypothetical protein
MDAMRPPMTARRSTTILATLLGVLLTVLVAARPASAAVFVTLTVSDGTIGVAQKVTAVVDSSALGSPSGTVVLTADGKQIGSQSVGGTAGGTATVSWTPVAAANSVVVAAFTADSGETASATKTVTIARVDTLADTVVPGTAATNTQVTLAAVVRVREGTYKPTGGVTFYRSDGATLGTAQVDSTGRARTTYRTPTAAGTISLYAIYNGDANANASGRSATDTIRVTTTAATVSVTVPQTNYVNSPVLLTARITPTSGTGTVDFSINGKYIGTGRVATGVATLTWVPNALGTFTVTANYSGGNGVGSGTASNRVTVTQPLKADQITLTVAGTATLWQPGSANSLANGATQAFTVTSASGLPVSLSVVGPCSMAAVATVHVRGAGSPCILSASTAGGNGFSPTTQKYTIVTATGPQTARVSAPKSGTYKRGAKLKLSRTSTVTSLNQPVKWKVTSGSSVCKVGRTGAWYTLKLVKKGTCKVRGSAPAIAGQWAAYSTTRSYKVK